MPTLCSRPLRPQASKPGHSHGIRTLYHIRVCSATSTTRYALSALDSLAAPLPSEPYLEPWIREDISTHRLFTFEALLVGLLRHRFPSKSEDEARALLVKCLKSVVPIANGFDPARANKNMVGSAKEMLAHLQAFCKPVRHETERYKPFVYFCNYALAALSQLNLEEFPKRKCPKHLFHRNDPNIISAVHHPGAKSRRKPDIALVPYDEALQNATETQHWSEVAFVLAPHPPEKSTWDPQWQDLPHSVEMKTTNRSTFKVKSSFSLAAKLEDVPAMKVPLSGYVDLPPESVISQTSNLKSMHSR
ncbi:hypothetical protein BOTBODRAFT_489460 [Botryobasidium botryosum FD-172 SS1]|uniref:Uncharacterized protein n=1 Tax=Botryobasidium botryosum (strain FD-172 SS1) TaxID=930990 RepID=A0A067MG42_BOTB1|nr:hypothetical protein BOTBODRAFT_489460 [Botryobasidium botryosum FD-172 SS1]